MKCFPKKSTIIIFTNIFKLTLTFVTASCAHLQRSEPIKQHFDHSHRKKPVHALIEKNTSRWNIKQIRDEFMGSSHMDPSATIMIKREFKILSKSLRQFKTSLNTPMKFTDKKSHNFISVPYRIKTLCYKYFSQKPYSHILGEINGARVELKDQLKLFEKPGDLDKVSPVYALVKRIYSENFGIDDYTWKTDGENEYGRGHYHDVAAGLKRPISVTKAIATFMHDLERFFPNTKVAYLNPKPMSLMGGKSIDGTLRKKALHPANSAKLAELILRNNDILSSKEKTDIYRLILYHDAGENGLDLDLSYQRTLTKIEILPPLKKIDAELIPDLRDLSDADALAFFRKTMPHFILREVNNLKEIYNNAITTEQINQYLENRIVDTLFDRIKIPGDKQVALRWMLVQTNIHPAIAVHWDYVKRSLLEKTVTPLEETPKNKEASKKARDHLVL